MTQSETYKPVSIVAKKLGMHPKTLQRHIREGRIKAKRFGGAGHYRIPMSQFEDKTKQN